MPILRSFDCILGVVISARHTQTALDILVGCIQSCPFASRESRLLSTERDNADAQHSQFAHNLCCPTGRKFSHDRDQSEDSEEKPKKKSRKKKTMASSLFEINMASSEGG